MRIDATKNIWDSECSRERNPQTLTEDIHSYTLGIYPVSSPSFSFLGLRTRTRARYGMADEKRSWACTKWSWSCCSRACASCCCCTREIRRRRGLHNNDECKYACQSIFYIAQTRNQRVARRTARTCSAHAQSRVRSRRVAVRPSTRPSKAFRRSWHSRTHVIQTRSTWRRRICT